MTLKFQKYITKVQIMIKKKLLFAGMGQEEDGILLNVKIKTLKVNDKYGVTTGDYIFIILSTTVSKQYFTLEINKELLKWSLFWNSDAKNVLKKLVARGSPVGRAKYETYS